MPWQYHLYPAHPQKDDKDTVLREILSEEKDSVLIYCCSQNEILNLCKKIVDQDMISSLNTNLNDDFAGWIDRNIFQTGT